MVTFLRLDYGWPHVGANERRFAGSVFGDRRDGVHLDAEFWLAGYRDFQDGLSRVLRGPNKTKRLEGVTDRRSRLLKDVPSIYLAADVQTVLRVRRQGDGMS